MGGAGFVTWAIIEDPRYALPDLGGWEGLVLFGLLVVGGPLVFGGVAYLASRPDEQRRGGFGLGIHTDGDDHFPD
jgi:hypothetical protein